MREDDRLNIIRVFLTYFPLLEIGVDHLDVADSSRTIKQGRVAYRQLGGRFCLRYHCEESVDQFI